MSITVTLQPSYPHITPPASLIFSAICKESFMRYEMETPEDRAGRMGKI